MASGAIETNSSGEPSSLHYLYSLARDPLSSSSTSHSETKQQLQEEVLGYKTSNSPVPQDAWTDVPTQKPKGRKRGEGEALNSNNNSNNTQQTNTTLTASNNNTSSTANTSNGGKSTSSSTSASTSASSSTSASTSSSNPSANTASASGNTKENATAPLERGERRRGKRRKTVKRATSPSHFLLDPEEEIKLGPEYSLDLPARERVDVWLRSVGSWYYTPKEVHSNGVAVWTEHDYDSKQYCTLDVLQNPIRKKHVTDNWTPKEIGLFEGGVCKYGKDFALIGRKTGLNKSKSTQQIVEFYYKAWKKSSHYLQWKYSAALKAVNDGTNLTKLVSSSMPSNAPSTTSNKHHATNHSHERAERAERSRVPLYNQSVGASALEPTKPSATTPNTQTGSLSSASFTSTVSSSATSSNSTTVPSSSQSSSSSTTTTSSSSVPTKSPSKFKNPAIAGIPANILWDPERDGDCPRVLAWDNASKQEYYIKVPPSDHGPAGADGGSGSSNSSNKPGTTLLFGKEDCGYCREFIHRDGSKGYECLETGCGHFFTKLNAVAVHMKMRHGKNLRKTED